jgi:hypothetical protein
MMSISKFKAICLAVLAGLRKTAGKPIADIVPPKADPVRGWLGSMSDSVEIAGDLAEPVGAFERWGN